MPDNSKEIIKQFAEDLVRDLQKQTPVATGKTRDSIRAVIRKTGFDIFGGSQIVALIDGRKPTKSGAPKGSPTLQETILIWIRARSITPRERNMSIEQLSWAMANSIHMNGYRGRGDIYATVITKSRFNSLTKTLLGDKALSLQSDVIKEIKFV